MVSNTKEVIRKKLSATESQITDDEHTDGVAYEVPAEPHQSVDRYVFAVEYTPSTDEWHSIYRGFTDDKPTAIQEMGYISDSKQEAYKKLLRLVEEHY